MLGTHYFYWETIKHYIVAFGTMFSDIRFKRGDGVEIKVPIAYGPKEKFLARLQRREEHPNDRGYSIAMTLPRMSFEVTGMHYDSSRALNRMNQYVKPLNSGGVVPGEANKMKHIRAGAPYNISFDLVIMAKFESDVSAMLDIILPMFRPEQTVSVHITKDKDVPYSPSIPNWQRDFNSGVDIIIDTPIIFNSMNLEDTYEGDFETGRILKWTLSFTMKGWFLGSSESTSIIKLPQSTVSPEGTFHYIPYTDTKNWAQITIDDKDNIKWYEEFTAL